MLDDAAFCLVTTQLHSRNSSVKTDVAQTTYQYVHVLTASVRLTVTIATATTTTVLG